MEVSIPTGNAVLFVRWYLTGILFVGRTRREASFVFAENVGPLGKAELVGALFAVTRLPRRHGRGQLFHPLRDTHEVRHVARGSLPARETVQERGGKRGGDGNFFYVGSVVVVAPFGIYKWGLTWTYHLIQKGFSPSWSLRRFSFVNFSNRPPSSTRPTWIKRKPSHPMSLNCRRDGT